MDEFSSSDSNDDDNDEIDDVDDDELEQLARINAKFNIEHLTEKPTESKGTNAFS